jgi:hypothetical protein
MKSSKQPAIVENAKSGERPRIPLLPKTCAVAPNSDSSFGAYGANQNPWGNPARWQAAPRKEVVHV